MKGHGELRRHHYRETELLIDPKTASDEAKKNVSVVIAHENGAPVGRGSGDHCSVG